MLEPCVVWFTGISGAGKTTIGKELCAMLTANSIRNYLLDGDILRKGLCNDLSFSAEDRIENLRRACHVSHLLMDAGCVVVATFITPFEAARKKIRSTFSENSFFEVFIDTPLDVAKQRDVKGLYKDAISGKIQNFTGISSSYELPENSDLRINTLEMSPIESASCIMNFLQSIFDG